MTPVTSRYGAASHEAWLRQMFWWLIIIAGNVVGVSACLVARRRERPRLVLRRIGYVCGTLIVGSVCLSIVSVIHVLGVVPPIGMDPAVKDRIVAEGILESLDCAAIGFMAFLAPTVLATALRLRARTDADPDDDLPN